MNKTKRTAKKLAKKGRYGDRHLLHVNDAELMSLMATGRVTRNPRTGLPEAFQNPFSSFSNAMSFAADPLGILPSPSSRFGRALNLLGGPGGPESIKQAASLNDWGSPFASRGTSWDAIGLGATPALGPSGWLHGKQALNDPKSRNIGRGIGAAIGAVFAGGALAGGGAGAGGGTTGGEGAIGGTTTGAGADATGLGDIYAGGYDPYAVGSGYGGTGLQAGTAGASGLSVPAGTSFGGGLPSTETGVYASGEAVPAAQGFGGYYPMAGEVAPVTFGGGAGGAGAGPATAGGTAAGLDISTPSGGIAAAPEGAGLGDPFGGSINPEAFGDTGYGLGGMPSTDTGTYDPFGGEWSSDPGAWEQGGGSWWQSMMNNVSMPSLKTMLGTTNLGLGLYGAYNAYQGQKLQRQQAAQQQAYYNQLNALMANPNQVTSLPGYQFNLGQGTEAVQRRMASMGYGTSGNLAIALQKYGSDYSTAMLQQQENLLANQYGRAPLFTQNITDPYALATRSLAQAGYGASAFQ